MIKVKVSELSWAALDWAVADAIEWKEPIFGVGLIRYINEDRYLMMDAPDPDEPDDTTKLHHFNHYEHWSPSRIWGQCGPLIDKLHVDMCCLPGGKRYSRIEGGGRALQYGDTPLIAACRAIVAAKFGDEIEVPAELMEQSDAAS